jgi:tRNA threonylcarbamoyladenosine modification (KEOPS) complex  Pcc1 subunit
MHRATLVFQLSSGPARALHGALLPETGEDVPKSRARCALEDGALRVEIEADDLSALRAAINSYLRWSDAALRAAAIGGT